MKKHIVLAFAFACLTLQTPLRAHGSEPAWETGDTRCVPNFREEQPVGYLCVNVEPGSIYARSGLRDGDNVTKINGQPLTGPIEEAIDLWKEFEKADTATIEVERGDKLVTFHKTSHLRRLHPWGR